MTTKWRPSMPINTEATDDDIRARYRYLDERTVEPRDHPTIAVTLVREMQDSTEVRVLKTLMRRT